MSDLVIAVEQHTEDVCSVCQDEMTVADGPDQAGVELYCACSQVQALG